MATWRDLLHNEMQTHGESLSDLVGCTLTDAELTEKFDDGYGSEQGKPFTAWTSNRVYFPACYDGSEWVASVSRNPDNVPTHHIGGG